MCVHQYKWDHGQMSWGVLIVKFWGFLSIATHYSIREATIQSHTQIENLFGSL